MPRFVEIALCASVCLAAASGVQAEGLPPEARAPVRDWSWEVGARYYYSTGRNVLDLSRPDSTATISRLDYDDLQAHSGEVFFKTVHTSGLFFKGFWGGGNISDGRLDDEDYCRSLPTDPSVCAGSPTGATYSDTDSDAEGDLRYFTIDVGYYFYKSAQTYANDFSGTGARLGAFVGYNYWNEKVDAYGVRCNPVDTGASGSPLCSGASPGDLVVPFSIKEIIEENTWRSWRIGVLGDINLTQRVNLAGEVAYLRVDQDFLDIHFTNFGPRKEPAAGNGDGVQAEVVLTYALSSMCNVGVGGRWWHLETEAEPLLGGSLDYETDRYGVFVQVA